MNLSVYIFHHEANRCCGALDEKLLGWARGSQVTEMAEHMVSSKRILSSPVANDTRQGRNSGRGAIGVMEYWIVGFDGLRSILKVNAWAIG